MNYMSKCSKSASCTSNTSCSKKHEHCCPTVIKCNVNTTTTSLTSTSTTALDLVTVNVNTCNIDNPCSKIDFAANIAFPTDAAGTLTFQLFKAPFCNLNNATAVGPAWTVTGVAGTTTATSFTTCDCNANNNFCNCRCNCNYDNDCSIYFIRVTPAITAGTVTLTNPTIGVISTCNTNPCCC